MWAALCGAVAHRVRRADRGNGRPLLLSGIGTNQPARRRLGRTAHCGRTTVSLFRREEGSHRAISRRMLSRPRLLPIWRPAWNSPPRLSGLFVATRSTASREPCGGGAGAGVTRPAQYGWVPWDPLAGPTQVPSAQRRGRLARRRGSGSRGVLGYGMAERRVKIRKPGRRSVLQ
jgi:hypothetical protein